MDIYIFTEFHILKDFVGRDFIEIKTILITKKFVCEEAFHKGIVWLII